MTTTNKQRQAAYRARMRSSGMVILHQWVKRELVEKIREYINQLHHNP